MDEQYFKDKKTAFQWYVDNGGCRKVSSFYSTVNSIGRKVSRLTISEMLRRENLKTKPTSQSDQDDLRRDAETRKAVAAADREEMKRDEERRELDREWIKRADADMQVCAWAALTRDAIAHRLKKSTPALIHAAGGNIDMAAAVQAVIDQAITDGCNDIANSGEVEVDIEAIDDFDEAV